jgi:outer membrane protein assembly factor BamD
MPQQQMESSRMSMKIRLFLAATALAALAAGPQMRAQEATPPTDPNPPQTTGPVTGNTTVTTDDQGHKQVNSSITFSTKDKKKKVDKADRIQQTKDTRTSEKKRAKLNPLIGKDSQLPDKQLYDKALAQLNSGHYDVARLDLQTLLNTYPDSQYQMRAKLAVADAWYKEGGSAALTQAEQEYKDFITFFPNVPEAAEAQLRVGDIYFKQMDVPDRDYSKGVHAEEEYRTMLKQYPDAPPALIAEAKQKLREVQEVMATREAELGAFYASHANWAASIARYQTVIDTYPLYSHMDDTLIGVGDAYEAEARSVRSQPVCTATLHTGCLPEGARAKLLEEYDGKAAEDYRKVVLDHASAPHVEDAKERLAAMNLPIPTPTPEQIAASDALEGSRAQYTMSKRLALFFLHRPDTVLAPQIGDPPLDDPPPTTAPAVIKGIQRDYVAAFNPNAVASHPVAAAPTSTDTGEPVAPAAPPVSNAPLSLSDVPAAGQGAVDTSSHTVTEVEPTSSDTGSGGAKLGVEVLTPGASTPPSDLPAATGKQDPNYGLKTVAPKDATALPPVEKPAEAPDQVNSVAGTAQPAAQTKDANGKTHKDAVDKTDESSSKKKPKKGLDKLNPF